MGVGEVTVVILLKKTGTAYLSNVRLRGMPDSGLAFRPEAKVVEGRPIRPGTDEAIIGSQLVGRFEGLELGSSFEIKGDRRLNVVGVFESDGSTYESEIWADLDRVQSTFGRETIVSSVRVRLNSSEQFRSFSAAVEGEKHLGLEAMRESDYYEKQSEGTATFIGIMGTVISLFFSIGAMIGAMITMHAMVAHRTREIGTLRALGFTRKSVMASFLIESMLLAIVGGLIGIVAAMGLSFVRFSMMNFVGWNEVVFRFRPTLATLAIALTFGALMGLVGGFLPALRAAHILPASAMRE